MARARLDKASAAGGSPQRQGFPSHMFGHADSRGMRSTFFGVCGIHRTAEQGPSPHSLCHWPPVRSWRWVETALHCSPWWRLGVQRHVPSSSATNQMSPRTMNASHMALMNPQNAPLVAAIQCRIFVQCLPLLHLRCRRVSEGEKFTV